jgi:hypothetical protein
MGGKGSGPKPKYDDPYHVINRTKVQDSRVRKAADSQ